MTFTHTKQFNNNNNSNNNGKFK